MSVNTESIIHHIMERISEIGYVKPEDIPNIDLYMDQVTTFMEAQLAHSKRYKDDKILTKTMINNYAKNKLLPPPEKKHPFSNAVYRMRECLSNLSATQWKMQQVLEDNGLLDGLDALGLRGLSGLAVGAGLDIGVHLGDQVVQGLGRSSDGVRVGGGGGGLRLVQHVGELAAVVVVIHLPVGRFERLPSVFRGGFQILPRVAQTVRGDGVVDLPHTIVDR